VDFSHPVKPDIWGFVAPHGPDPKESQMKQGTRDTDSVGVGAVEIRGHVSNQVEVVRSWSVVIGV
jgi:hypothetical protein